MKWDWLAGGMTRHAYYWHSYDSRVSFYQDCDARDAHGKIPSFFSNVDFFLSNLETNCTKKKIRLKTVHSLGATFNGNRVVCTCFALSRTNVLLCIFVTHLETGNLTLSSQQHHRKKQTEIKNQNPKMRKKATRYFTGFSDNLMCHSDKFFTSLLDKLRKPVK